MAKIEPVAQHYNDRDGNYLGAFYGAAPPAGAVPTDGPPTPPWNKQREAAIREQILGGEGAIARLVEVLVIEMVARGEAVSPEFTSLITKVQEIRAAYPRP